MKRTILSPLLALFLLLTGCEKEPILIVGTTSLEFTENGGTNTLSFIANNAWTANSSSSWCKLSPFAGDATDNNNVSLTVTCEANASYEDRTCTISILSGDLSKSITVTQQSNYGMFLTQTQFEVSSEAQQLKVDLRSNVNYQVNVDSQSMSWIKVVSTKGLENHSIVLDIVLNSTGEPRTGTLTVKDTQNDMSETVTITQRQNDVLTITSQKEITLTCAEQIIEIAIDANIDFEISVPKDAQEWVSILSTKAISHNRVQLRILENFDFSNRECVLSVVQKNGSLKETVHIVQEAAKEISPSAFPDPEFRNYVFDRFDKNHDNRLTKEECEAVKKIDLSTISTDNIYSVKGIEYFRNLTRLYCGGTGSYDERTNTWIRNGKLTSLDVSKNGALVDLDFMYNNITTIDVSQNPNLAYLCCAANRLTSLDVSKNPDLIELICGADGVSSLDLSNNQKLKALLIGGNEITSLDVTKNKDLEDLECDGAHKLAKILLDNPKLKVLSCQGGELVSLDVSKCPLLKSLYCGGNHLTVLDISHNPELTTLYCDSNDLTTLSIPKGLSALVCSGNKLTSLAFPENAQLIRLACEDNLLSSIDVNKALSLQSLNCDKNRLSKLDVSNNTNLRDLYCRNNNMTDIHINASLRRLSCENNDFTSIDVSYAKDLEFFHLDNNKLTQLDVTRNPNLLELLCRNNNLKTLDVSNNTYLHELRCEGNPLEYLYIAKGQSFIWGFSYPDGTTIVYK